MGPLVVGSVDGALRGGTGAIERWSARWEKDGRGAVGTCERGLSGVKGGKDGRRTWFGMVRVGAA